MRDRFGPKGVIGFAEIRNDSGGKDINNPKIPVKFVRQNGQLVHSATFELSPPPSPTNPKLVAEAEQDEE